MKRLLAALGRMEQYFAARDPHKEPKLNQPLAGLTPHWLQASDDGSVEFRLAAALASIGATGKVGPLRANLSPIDPQRNANWAGGSGQRAWAGSDLCGRLAGVLRRRIMDAERLGCERNPLWAELTVAAGDAATLIHGPVDEDMIEALLFSMGLIDWKDACMSGIAADRTRAWREAAGEAQVPRSWVLLKYLFLPGPVATAEGNNIVIRSEEAIVPLLCADRVKEACEIAIRRWRASGLRPPHIHFEHDAAGPRLAAALLLPVPEFALRPYFKVEEGDSV
jgi:CRISPR-associated protein Csx17